MSKRVILVVDDDGGVRSLLEAVLEAAGFQVVTAAEAAGAWTTFSTVQPAAILLDWMLPGVDGGTLCARLRRAAGDRLPILMMSADDRLAQRARDFGADGYLLKPFDIGDLLDRLDQLVERHSARHLALPLSYAQ